jgi:hypothetical protein
MIFSEDWDALGTTTGATAAAARVRWTGFAGAFPRTWVRAEDRRPTPRRCALGLEEMIYEIFSETRWPAVANEATYLVKGFIHYIQVC